MGTEHTRRFGLLAPSAAPALLLLPWAATGAVECETIRFKPGARSAEIRGLAPAEGGQCFRFGAGQGQTVEVSVKSKRDQVAVTVGELADNRTHYRFTSEKKTYTLGVHQTFRAVEPVPYVLTLSIK